MMEPVQGSGSQLKSARGVWLVYSKNQHQAGTTWWPSHEWDWSRGCTESVGLAAVHHKTVKVSSLSHKSKTEDSAGGYGVWVR
jgi:hypothetical protein